MPKFSNHKKIKKMKTRKLNLLILLFVFILCGNQKIRSQIEFTDLIPDIKIIIPDSSGGNYYDLDINNDDLTDYKIGCKLFYTNEMTDDPIINFWALFDSIGINRIDMGPFWDGDTIQSSQDFCYKAYLLGWLPENTGFNGQWYFATITPDTFAYAGMEFHVGEQIFYGWIRMKTNGLEIIIDKFAWNEIPGQFIIAGQSE
jgi:hypothetical protein